MVKEPQEVKKAYRRLDSFSELKTIKPEEAGIIESRKILAEMALLETLDRHIQGTPDELH